MVLSVALATYLVSTLAGFVSGYEQAVRRDVEGMGFDLLVTARGCPYEAATLMLRGGIGLRYMPDGVVQRLDEEPEVLGTYPTLIHPVRDPGSDGGMMLLKGVTVDLLDAQGWVLASGEWLDVDTEGVVLGFEAAEYEQRHVGDEYLIPGGEGESWVKSRVLGILERTGTQVDGAVLIRLDALQQQFGLENKLTGVGVQIDPTQRDGIQRLQEAYDSEAELQVIRLSTIVQALKQAMDKMRGVVQILVAVLVLVAAAFLLNSGLLRSVAEHRQYVILRAVGLPDWFLVGACFIENLVLLWMGASLGLLMALGLGAGASAILAQYLPYTPSGNLIDLSPSLALQIWVGAALLAVLSTLPSGVRLRYFADVESLRWG